MFESDETKLKKLIEQRKRKLEELKKHADQYKEIAEQEEEYRKLKEGPLKEYLALQEEKRRKAQERNTKIVKALDIMANHLVGDEEKPKKKDKKVRS